MKAYQVIDSPEKWTTGTSARDCDGMRIGIEDERARSFCTIGAIFLAYTTDACAKVSILYDIVGGAVSDWNDSSDWQTVYNKLKELDI